MRGVAFDDPDELLDTVREVGPGGHFLGAAHTRRANLFIFPSQSNITYEQWKEEGARDSAAAGLEKAKRWLDRYEPPPIDPALDEALRDFVARREREIPATLT